MYNNFVTCCDKKGEIMEKRVEKRELIIAKARDIFLDKGLFNTVMDDIAVEAGLTRRTLYRYFETKEDLAYETAILLLSEWNEFHREVFIKLSGSGINQLQHFLNELIDYMVQRVNIMKYLGEFDFYFKDDKAEKPSSESILKFESIILVSDGILTELLERGIKDGSVKPDVDVKLMMNTISNVLWSFGQRIAIRGEMIEKESGISGVSLINNQVDIYMMALKSDA